MTQTFFERNKKKSFLGLLLLFLRERKALALLLFVLLLGTLLLASSSDLLLHMPGGARLAAGLAWTAQKAGLDVSKWGLGAEKKSFRELMSAFRAAKEGGAHVGWSSFFGRPPEGVVGGADSLGWIRGTRKDLESLSGGQGGGNKRGFGGGLKGILSPAESKANPNQNGVALTGEELAGQRQALAEFGGDPNGDLSGKAFVGKGFFSGGKVSTAANLQGRLRSQLANTSVATAKTSSVGKSNRMAAMTFNQTSKAQSGKAINSLSIAYAVTQLASEEALVTIGNENCSPPACPEEFASTAMGSFYDGNGNNPSILSNPSSTGGTDSTDFTTPDTTGITDDAAKIAECTSKLQACVDAKTPYMTDLGTLADQANALAAAMSSDCKDDCHCGNCENDKRQITALCTGPMQADLTKIAETCDLPDYCADLGVTDTSGAGATKDLCAYDMKDCGCGTNYGSFSDFWCNASCLDPS